MSWVVLVPVSSSIYLRVMCLVCKAEPRRQDSTTDAQSDLRKHERTPQPGGITVPKSTPFKPNKTYRSSKKKKNKERKGGRTQPGLASSLWDPCCCFSRAELVPPCPIILDRGVAAAVLCRAPAPASHVQFAYKAPELKGPQTVRKHSSGVAIGQRYISSSTHECKCLAGQVDGTPNKPVCG